MSDMDEIRAALNDHEYTTVIAVIDRATKTRLVLHAATVNTPPEIVEALAEKGWTHLEMVAGAAIQAAYMPATPQDHNGD